MFSYQCSQLSTPDSVIEVFNTAKRFQKNQDTSKYVSVVVLDEVGLAEDSPNLPLKALHPLLEDGTEGADDSDQVCTCKYTSWMQHTYMYIRIYNSISNCSVFLLPEDRCKGEEGGIYRYLQLGPGSSQDEQRRYGDQR